MDFGEFSDVSLDTNDSSNFKSCDESLSEVEDSGAWSNEITNVTYSKEQSVPDYSKYDDFTEPAQTTLSLSPNSGNKCLIEPSIKASNNKLTRHASAPLPGRNGVTFQKVHIETQETLHRERFSGGSDGDATSESEPNSPTHSTVSHSTSTECVDDSKDNEHSSHIRHSLQKQGSRNSIDELLFDLYDKHGVSSSRHNSICSLDGSSTDCSSLSEYQLHKSDAEAGNTQHTSSGLQEHSIEELKDIVFDLSNKVIQKNTQLVKCLRNRERHRNRGSKHCDMITAILQAWSSKSRSDAKMKFTIEPGAGDINFEQWRDAIKSLVRGPAGIPSHFRHKVWLALATNYIASLQLDWNKVVQFAFNDKCNPDDDALGAQIVKDLHRTGCSSFSGIENEEDRAILQRVLLGYARWNKVTGYCQGFNILAAFILNVTNKNEADALKVMVYLVDHMLPKEYFAHNLRALTVDMAVFRKYLSMKLPKLSSHLVRLQQDARDDSTGANVEPPLTNVFTMQWFLTMFATCLPMNAVLKIWDCVMVDGDEILIRTALSLWTKLAKKVIRSKTADEFYMTMGTLTNELLEGKIIPADELIHSVYNMAPLPLPKFTELRERYMYDITPFSAAMNSASHKAVYNEDDVPEDIQELARKQDLENKTHHSMDVALLKKQYSKLTQRQRQAKLLMKGPVSSQSSKIIPSSASPIAINHLFVGKQLAEKKKAKIGSVRAKEVIRSRSIDMSVRPCTPAVSDTLSTKLDIYATTPQGSHQAMKYKMRVESLKNGQEVKDDQDLESSIKDSLEKKTLVRRCSSNSSSEDDVTEQADEDTSPNHAPVSRQLSTSSVSSAYTNDSVFEHDAHSSSTPSKPCTNQRRFSDHAVSSPVHRYKVKTNHTAEEKAFNPFPKPSTGLLSAEKAKVGIKFGLYKPEEALSYIKPSEREHFLKDGDCSRVQAARLLPHYQGQCHMQSSVTDSYGDTLSIIEASYMLNVLFTFDDSLLLSANS